MTDHHEDRGRGALLGLACGDALGRPVEFRGPMSIEQRHGRIEEMLADGTHSKPAGMVTDDTDMAVCIARSLVASDQFDGADIAQRFVEWARGPLFDIGGLTRASLNRIRSGEAWDEAGYNELEVRDEGKDAGNGSLMRCAPHGIAHARPATLVDVSIKSSAITHADPRCTLGCALLNLTISNLIDGQEKPLGTASDQLESHRQVDSVPGDLRDVIAAVTASEPTPDLQSRGYVIDTLRVGLHYGLHAETAQEAIIEAVMCGGDTDTNGSVAGAVAGARFGASALPSEWVDQLQQYRNPTDDFAGDLIELADELVALRTC